jgi:Tol biopolymer transport system component
MIDFISIESGEVSRRIPIPPDAVGAFLSPDGQKVAYYRRERGVHNLWQQPVRGGDPLRLTDFHLSRATNQTILAFAWSPDGKRFGITRNFSKAMP